ncbi:hypothetical protein [Aminobacter sp. HY435]|uniref:hypothetical protein n=1 Tax=Aminobacter sp. HY435 TaxID=2970917 RepID=UPI0022B96D3B|nr:hypothetical protein [Aminobacter sp. HY435]
MTAVAPVTDKNGRFLTPGIKVRYGKHEGTITVFGHGWARVRRADGKVYTKKPTRIEVAA